MCSNPLDRLRLMQMENVVGNRHKLHPCIKHEKYRGSSQIRFSDGDPDSRRPWKTTNQACNRTVTKLWLSGNAVSQTSSLFRCCSNLRESASCEQQKSVRQSSTKLEQCEDGCEKYVAGCRCSPNVLRYKTQLVWPTVASAALLPRTCTRSRASMGLLLWLEATATLIACDYSH